MTSKFDVSALFKGLQGLKDESESIARRMLVAGGQVFRDEAKARAPEGDEISGAYSRRPEKTGSKHPGTLKNAVYLSRNDKRTGDGVYAYVVSWNSQKSFWGVFNEFGFKRPYKIIYAPNIAGYVTFGAHPVGGVAKFAGLGRKDKAALTRTAKSPYVGPAPRFEGSQFLGIAYDVSLPEISRSAIAEGKLAFAEAISKVGGR